MKNISFEPTTCTPAVRFNTEGRLFIEGRSLPENVSEFYNPLISWVNHIDTSVVRMDLNLEYLNSASSKKILEILKTIDKNENVKVFIVNWHYEADDEDILESGQIYEDLLIKAEFRYHEYSEA